MRDGDTLGDGGGESLALQALLDASGELDAGQATVFEERLGTDQSAREALCQAVQLTLALEGHAPSRPNPAYRERVRQRLRHARACGRRWPASDPIAAIRPSGAAWERLPRCC